MSDPGLSLRIERSHELPEVVVNWMHPPRCAQSREVANYAVVARVRLWADPSERLAELEYLSVDIHGHDHLAAAEASRVEDGWRLFACGHIEPAVQSD